MFSERLNGFDEDFGSYLEDVDLGLRCVREGYRGIYVPDAVAWHHGSATLGRWNRARGSPDFAQSACC